ncbi:MAG: hydrolase [Sphingobacteriales bacterium]|nr:MAG: hydrolase [Sphingobacteriales bacterium]
MEKYNCPCCGFKTFNREPNGTYDLCLVCFWEDDRIQLEEPDYEGGANKVSLNQAKANFKKYGACEKRFIENVRLPKKDEK